MLVRRHSRVHAWLPRLATLRRPEAGNALQNNLDIESSETMIDFVITHLSMSGVHQRRSRVVHTRVLAL